MMGPPQWLHPMMVPQSAPLGQDPLTIQRMEILALKERAEKHGNDIDTLGTRMKALEDLLAAAKRYGVWALLSAASLIGHFNADPLAQKVADLLRALASGLGK